VPETTSLTYRWLVRLATAAIPLGAVVSPKLRRGHAGRIGALGRLASWARTHRDVGRPLVWLHAASVGEGLQAAAVLEELRRRHHDWQYVFTHFSPSAEIGADVADFLPYDLPGAADSLLEALRPSVLVFAKLDLWPELASRAAARGVPVALVAGTVSPVSGRTRWPARNLQRPGYAAVSAAGVISEDDGGRLATLGVPEDRIRVTGDPRFDSVAAVVNSVPADDPLLGWGRGAPTMVAGSTWPLDEAVVLEAFAAVRTRRPQARLVLAPHEPTPAHLDRVEHLASRLGLPAPVRLGAAAGPVPFLLVDRVGVLARIYGGGSMAYVGGGFGRAGLHSVLEPAAWGIPVVFGPWWANSREAGLLLDRNAARSLPPRSQGAGQALARIWNDWIEDETAARTAGAAARSLVDSGLGAARRSARLVEELLSD